MTTFDTEYFDAERVADDFLASNIKGIAYPPAWFDRLTMDQAMAVQHAILGRKVANGEVHVGWKVGLTAEAIQSQFNVHEPVCGYLLDSGMISSGSELNWDELTRPGFENEICFRMARDLKGPGVTAEMARAAVSTLSPAIELVENRGDFTAQLAVSLADNVQQCGFILGSPIVCEDSLDIGSVDARVFVNDDLAGQGNAIAVLGNPFNSLAWLANKLSEFGQSVKVDQWIMAGSLTRQFALGRGDRIATLFSALGAVEFRII